MPKKELTPEEKAALDKVRSDPKYQEMRGVVKTVLEDVIDEMVSSEPPTDDENIFDYLARKIKGG